MFPLKSNDRIEIIEDEAEMATVRAGDLGTIISVESDSFGRYYSVRMDDGNYWEFTDISLRRAPGTNAPIGPESVYYQPPRCECGASSVGSNRHSNYCPFGIGF